MKVRLRNVSEGHPVKGQATYCRVVVGKSVVNSHVFEEALDVLIKEALDFAVVEVRIDEDRSNVGFENVR